MSVSLDPEPVTRIGSPQPAPHAAYHRRVGADDSVTLRRPLGDETGVSSGRVGSGATGTLFTFLWASAHILHSWHQEGTGHGDPLTEPWLWLVLMVAVATLCRPSSRPLLVLLAMTQLVAFAAQYPFVANHWTIAAFVNAGLIGSFVSSAKEASRDIFTVFAPYGRIVFLISYGAAAIAKLNTTFLDPQHSCAVTTLEPVVALVGLRVPEGGPASALVWMVLITELSVPMLLLIPATRLLGIGLAMTFHVALAASPAVVVMDFTFVVISLLLLFAPADLGDRLREDGQAFQRRRPTLTRAARSLAPLRIWAAAAVFLLAVLRGSLVGAALWALLTWGVFLVFGMVTLAAGLSLLVSYRGRKGPDVPGASRRPEFFHWLLLLALLFNASSPYLGLKTTSSFTMFSNLRTEGGETNHLFLPRLFIAGYQDDLVEIKSYSDDRLQRYVEDRQLITRHELRRIVATDPDQSLTYVRDGKQRSVSEAREDPLLSPLPSWETKLLHFRSVTVSGNPICQA